MTAIDTTRIDGAANHRPAMPIAVRADRRNARANASGNLVHVLLEGRQTGGAFALVELLEQQAPPRHIHHREDELIYVLEGEISVEIDGERFRAPAGTAALIPRGCIHGFAIEEGPARLLVVFTPAGSEGLFLATSEPVASLDLPPLPTDAADPSRVAKLAAPFRDAYGIEIVGPPVPPRAAVGRHDRMNGA
jgi:quercetin dioxygenase-like cupin family protein